MSLLGIDVGTTGCKAVIFSTEGITLASAYEEYDVQRPHPGYAELDTVAVWEKVKTIIRKVALDAKADPVQALSVSSLGEAFVPISRDKKILGPSLLNFDQRGEEFIDNLSQVLDNKILYEINGNTIGNQYSLTKLLWLKMYQPRLYEQTDRFMHWSGFVTTMLGSKPFVDYSLANRTLLFDIDHGKWSEFLLDLTKLDLNKLPKPVPSGTVVGKVSPKIAEELNLPPSVTLIAGAHDQCANALGCGVINEGQAMYGMGTYFCVTPVFQHRKNSMEMIGRGLNTEHHAVPGLFVSFIYNLGGALVKWFRDTFAAVEKKLANETGRDIYYELISEIPSQPSDVLVLPHFAPTGPPEFINNSSGVMIGLKLETKRGDILKGIMEGTTYYLKECVDSLPATGITIQDYRAAGGGSKSDIWLQVCADILNRPFVRPAITEAGALGAAILAGVGSGLFNNFNAGVETMVKLGRKFEPDPKRVEMYEQRYLEYRQIWPTMKDLLTIH